MASLKLKCVNSPQVALIVDRREKHCWLYLMSKSSHLQERHYAVSVHVAPYCVSQSVCTPCDILLELTQ